MSEFIKKYHSHYVATKIDPKSQECLSERAYETIESLFRKILKKAFNGRLLDIGCGSGSFVGVCNKKKRVKAAGVDISDGCDFESNKLPYNDSEFDIVLMYSIIEHLHNPNNILNEVKRVLKANGTEVIITSEWKYAFRLFYNDPTHVRPYTSESLNSLMGMYGFKKLFLGLWIVKKGHLVWKLPEKIQFLYGKLLPFTGLNKYAPNFLKGRSTSMIACFENSK